jgi:transcription factor MYB, plant
VSDFKPEKDGRIRWKAIASQIQNRNAKQVRERWLNHLRPDMKKGDWTEEEELILFELQGSMGNK